MKSPRHFIPTLQELRALEAVSRHGSISAAATELNVSQPTISYHIKQLESRWEAKLFIKKGRKLEPTELVQDTFTQVSSINANIDSLSSFLSQQSHQKPLAFSSAPSFASIVLEPRLDRFADHFPEADLSVSATNRYVDFAREHVDVVLRLLPRLESTMAISEPTPLIPVPDEQMRVVCSPQYLAQQTDAALISRGMDIEILRHCALIHEHEAFHWQKYLTAWLPESDELLSRRLTFNNADLILSSALAGRGMAIMRDLYVQDALRAGTLIEPFAHTLPCDRVFQFVLPEHKMPSAQSWEFITWLGNEMRAIMAD